MKKVVTKLGGGASARYIGIAPGRLATHSYINILRSIIDIVDDAYFGGRISGDADKGLLRLRITRIRRNYNIKLNVLNCGDVESVLTMNRRLFDKYPNYLGDRACGVVHVFIRALCEHFAKLNLRTSELKLAGLSKLATKSEKVDRAAAVLRDAWGAHGIDDDLPESIPNDPILFIQKFHNKGWWVIYQHMVRKVAGHFRPEPPLAKVTEEETLDAPFFIDRETLEVKRGEAPKRLTRKKIDHGNGGNGISVKIGAGAKLKPSPGCLVSGKKKRAPTF